MKKRMSEGGGADHGSSPKLYNHKPKKCTILSLSLTHTLEVFFSHLFRFIVCVFFFVTAQLKQFRGQQKSNEFSSPPSMGAQTAPPPPPPPPKEPFIKRYKFVWPMLLAVNLGIGGNFSTTPKAKNSIFRLSFCPLLMMDELVKLGFILLTLP